MMRALVIAGLLFESIPETFPERRCFRKTFVHTIGSGQPGGQSLYSSTPGTARLRTAQEGQESKARLCVPGHGFGHPVQHLLLERSKKSQIVFRSSIVILELDHAIMMCDVS